MLKPKWSLFVFLVISLLVIVPLVDAQEPAQAEREEMYHRYLELDSYVQGGSIEPHWMADGSSFWYAEGTPANTIIWKVDPRADSKTPLFDTARLRKELASLLEHEPPYQGLPFDTFTFVDEDEQTVKFTVEDKAFILWLATYRMSRPPTLSEEEKSRLAPKPGEVRSPDGRWFASIKEHNVWLRSTSDGRRWEVNWRPYTRAGDPLRSTQLFITNVASKQQIRLDTGNETDRIIFMPGWRPDASELLFCKVDREYKRVDLMAASPGSSATRVLLTETQKTFLLKAFWGGTGFSLLEDGKKSPGPKARGGSLTRRSLVRQH
jgi:hypothetical protein